MPHGKLFVIVESAAGIKDPSKHGRGNSYCTLQCGSQVFSTDVAEGAGSHPIFHTEFQFEIDRSTSDLVISVYSTGSTGDDKLVGYTTLDFKTVFFHAHTVPLTAYPLLEHSGRAGGHISISLKFKPRPSPYAHNPHAPMRRHSAPPAHPQNYEVDGYGSSGSENSRSGITDRRHAEQYYGDHAEYYEYQVGARSSYEAHHYHHPQRAQSQAPALAHQAIPHQAIPHQVIPHQAIPHQAIPHQAIQVYGGVQPVRRRQPAQRVQYQGMQPQRRGQPGGVAHVAGQIAGRVAEQGIQAMGGGFDDMLGEGFSDMLDGGIGDMLGGGIGDMLGGGIGDMLGGGIGDMLGGLFGGE